MLVIELNWANYEYDINSLVRAFYPGEQVWVLTPESTAQRRQEAEAAADEVHGIAGSAEAVGLAQSPKKEGNVLRMEVTLSEETAQVRIGQCSFQWRYEPLRGNARSKLDYKHEFKRFLYRILCEYTGKTLPWGSLIGIRPTKIAYGMLEEGKGDKEILDTFTGNYSVSEEKAALGLDIAKREREILKSIHCEGGGIQTEVGQAECGQVGNSQVGNSQIDNSQVDNSQIDNSQTGYSQTGYSLYIGIPFCPTTCLYCSFTSYPIAAHRKRVEQYIDCLIKEMDFVSQAQADKILDSVYIGGGTPTTLEPEQLDRLIKALRERFDLDNVKEFTVEAGRADSITREKLEVLYGHGVSRISVNPQTMKQETLDIIGRKARVDQVLSAYALAREVGFDNINMDIILGLPGELEEDVQCTIDKIVELAPDSLTVHSLAIKRASSLSKWILENGIATLNNTDETMRIAAEGAKRLGMKPYYLYRQKNMSGNFENVGYAKPGKYGLYNILIMEEVQTIVALGAGSITKRVWPDGRIERCDNVKEVVLYIEKIDEMIERKRKLFEEK